MVIDHDLLHPFQMSGYYAEPDDTTDENALIKGSIIATWALAVIVVCLRFVARRLSKASFWYDDWLVLPAAVSIPHIDNRSSYVESLGEQITLIRVPGLRHGVVLHLCCLEYVLRIVLEATP